MCIQEGNSLGCEILHLPIELYFYTDFVWYRDRAHNPNLMQFLTLLKSPFFFEIQKAMYILITNSITNISLHSKKYDETF